jgi:hypothetical protein
MLSHCRKTFDVYDFTCKYSRYNLDPKPTVIDFSYSNITFNCLTNLIGGLGGYIEVLNLSYAPKAVGRWSLGAYRYIQWPMKEIIFDGIYLSKNDRAHIDNRLAEIAALNRSFPTTSTTATLTSTTSSSSSISSVSSSTLTTLSSTTVTTRDPVKVLQEMIAQLLSSTVKVTSRITTLGPGITPDDAPVLEQSSTTQSSVTVTSQVKTTLATVYNALNKTYNSTAASFFTTESELTTPAQQEKQDNSGVVSQVTTFFATLTGQDSSTTASPTSTSSTISISGNVTSEVVSRLDQQNNGNTNMIWLWVFGAACVVMIVVLITKKHYNRSKERAVLGNFLVQSNTHVKHNPAYDQQPVNSQADAAYYTEPVVGGEGSAAPYYTEPRTIANPAALPFDLGNDLGSTGGYDNGSHIYAVPMDPTASHGLAEYDMASGSIIVNAAGGAIFDATYDNYVEPNTSSHESYSVFHDTDRAGEVRASAPHSYEYSMSNGSAI